MNKMPNKTLAAVNKEKPWLALILKFRKFCQLTPMIAAKMRLHLSIGPVSLRILDATVG